MGDGQQGVTRPGALFLFRIYLIIPCSSLVAIQAHRTIFTTFRTLRRSAPHSLPFRLTGLSSPRFALFAIQAHRCTLRHLGYFTVSALSSVPFGPRGPFIA